MYAHDGRLHFHRPFLDRLTNHKPDAPCALAAFLLLNVIDEMRHADFDAEAVNLRINAVYNPLGQTHSGDPQVFHLVRIAEKLRLITQTRNVASVTSDVIGYANWLTTESRFDEALSVLDTGDQLLVQHDHRLRATLQLRRGFSLTCKAHLAQARAAYTQGVEIASRKNDEPDLLLAKIGQAKVTRLQGHPVEARHALLQVDRRAVSAGLTSIHAIVSHDIGADPTFATGHALPFVVEAYHAYEQNHLKKRALADIAYMLVRLGNFELARRCITAVDRSAEGAAFQASVLGTLFWIVGQTADITTFTRLLKEYETLDHQLAISTEADLKLRIGQCFLIFADYVNASKYINEARELARNFGYTTIARAAEVSIEIIKGNQSIRHIQIAEVDSHPVINEQSRDNARLFDIFRELGC